MATGRVRTVSVRITAEVSDLEKKLQSVQKTLAKTGETFKSVGASLTSALTVPLAAVATAFGVAINFASDLAETQSKIGVVFGESAGKINEWSNTAATAFGQSKQQALDAAANFAIFGSSAGLAGDDLVSFSTDFVELASDLASFNNTSPEEAIEAIGAALRGEAEPLRKYGVLLDDATLRQAALSLGLIKTTKEALTPQQKVLAAQKVIYQQTGAAQGDFARTSDQLANQQRILTGQMKDASAEIGTALLPIALELANVFKDKVIPVIQRVAQWFKNLSPETVKTALKIGLVLAVLGPLVFSIGQVIFAVKSLGAALIWLNANPVVAILSGITLLVAAGIYLYKTWDTSRIRLAKIFVGLSSFAYETMFKMRIAVLEALKDIIVGIGALASFLPDRMNVFVIAGNVISDMIDGEKVKKNAKAFEHSMQQTALSAELATVVAEKAKKEVDKGSTSAKEAAKAQAEYKKALAELTLASAKSEKAQSSQNNAQVKAKKAAEDAAEAQKKLRDANLKTLDTLGDAVKKALQKRYESEEKLQMDSLTKQSNALKKATDDNIKQYNKEYSAKLKVFDAETDAELKTLQDLIDAIDGQTDAEEKALKEQEYQAKLAAKQQELLEAKSAKETLKITSELNKMIADREREHLLESRQMQINALKTQMDAVKNNADMRREAMKLELDEKILHEEGLSDAKLKSLDIEMESVKAHFAILTSEEALQAETRKIALDKNNKEIIDLLSKYNPQWQNAGQSFGESLLDGLNSTKASIKSAVSSMLALVPGAGAGAKAPITAPTNLANESAYLNNLIKTGTAGQATWAKAQGKKYNLPGFAVGTNFVPQDMIAMLHKGEAVVPKAFNSAAGGTGEINLYIDGKKVSDIVGRHMVDKIRTKTGSAFR